MKYFLSTSFKMLHCFYGFCMLCFYFIINISKTFLTNSWILYKISGSLLLESKIQPDTAYQKQQVVEAP